ncbi:MAG TPA: hypothetical protein VGF24_20295 [Vicinamibacterales bacterium]|jgi:hypothetical protein
MKDSDRRLLGELRRTLLPLHKTLLDWEREGYERKHGRVTKGELLRVIVSDPQFAWLRPISELIVRIDQTLDTEEPDTVVDVAAIVAQARRLVAPDEQGTPYEQRYYAALQEVPDAVFAHRAVTGVLKDAPSRETLH